MTLRTALFQYDDGVWSCEPARLGQARRLVAQIHVMRGLATELHNAGEEDAVAECKKSLIYLNKALACLASFQSTVAKERGEATPTVAIQPSAAKGAPPIRQIRRKAR